MTGLSLAMLTAIPFLLQVFFIPFPRLRARFLSGGFKCMTKAMLYFMRVRVHIVGSVPKHNFFMVGNHLSYVDILVLASVTGAAFVSKKEVRKWPVVGWSAKTYHTIFLDRESKHDIQRVTTVIDDTMQRLGRVIVFPEGTSTGGQSVLPFYSPLLEWPAKHHFPVHCVSISYRSSDPLLPAEHTVCWWGDMPFGPHLKGMLRLKRTDVTLHFADETVIANTRKVLAKAAEAVVVQHFTKSL